MLVGCGWEYSRHFCVSRATIIILLLMDMDECMHAGHVSVCTHLSHLTILYSFHVLWKSTLPSSLRWMTVHPPPAVSMLQYTYTIEKREQMRVGKHVWRKWNNESTHRSLKIFLVFRRNLTNKLINSTSNMTLNGTETMKGHLDNYLVYRHSFSQLS